MTTNFGVASYATVIVVTLFVMYTAYKYDVNTIRRQHAQETENKKDILRNFDLEFSPEEDRIQYICYIIRRSKLPKTYKYEKLYDTQSNLISWKLLNCQIKFHENVLTGNLESIMVFDYVDITIDKYIDENDNKTKYVGINVGDEDICYYIFKTKHDAETFLSEKNSHGGKRAKRRSRRQKQNIIIE